MTSEKPVDYIKKQRGKGKSDNEIESSLLQAGWKSKDISNLFSEVDGTTHRDGRDGEMQSGEFPGPVQLLTKAFEIFKERFWTLVIVSLVPTISLVVIGSFLFAGYFFTGTSSLPSLLMILLTVIFVLASMVVQSWGYTALLCAVDGYEEKLGVVESFKRGRKKILSYWWILWIEGFIILGGFLLFFIPGLIFSVWFSLSMFVMISEDLGGLNAIFKSKEYVRGKWLGVFARLLFILFLLGLVYVIPSILFEVLDLSWVGSVISSIVGFFTGPLITIYAYLIYRNLKQEKNFEGEFSVSKKTKWGFVLIGLLGGMIIPLVIFSVVALVAINPDEQLSRARDTGRKMDQETISRSLEMYYVDKGAYPADLDQLIPDYFSTLPKDPDTDMLYEYTVIDGGESYQFCINFEETGKSCSGPPNEDTMFSSPVRTTV